MLQPILIGGKKYKIKPIKDLTTEEFIELSKIENCDFIKYIAWQTGVSFEEAFYTKISKPVELAIGVSPDITKLPKSDKFDYTKLIDTVGQRHQVETLNVTGLELLVYCLAISQARSNNYEDVEKLRAEYLKENFAEILPAGFFFFKKYRAGRKRGLNFLNWLTELIRILRRKKRRGLND